MIATIQHRQPQHFAFRAMLSGLVVDEVAPGILDVTYHNPEKVLYLIKEIGGTVLSTTRRQPLTKAERFSK